MKLKDIKDIVKKAEIKPKDNIMNKQSSICAKTNKKCNKKQK